MAKQCSDSTIRLHRANFEEFADRGKLTRDRKSNPHWGFYRLPQKYDHEKYAFPYEDLINLPVAQATLAVRALEDLDESVGRKVHGNAPAKIAGGLEVTVNI